MRLMPQAMIDLAQLFKLRVTIAHFGNAQLDESY